MRRVEKNQRAAQPYQWPPGGNLLPTTGGIISSVTQQICLFFFLSLSWRDLISRLSQPVTALTHSHTHTDFLPIGSSIERLTAPPGGPEGESLKIPKSPVQSLQAASSKSATEPVLGQRLHPGTRAQSKRACVCLHERVVLTFKAS